jgi:hypothetical protein
MNTDSKQHELSQAAQLLPGLIWSATEDPSYLEGVQGLVKQSAFISLYAVDNPDQPDVPIPDPSNPKAFVGLNVHDVPHRWDVTVHEPTGDQGLRVSKTVAKASSALNLNWMVIPDDFEAAPGKYPPPVALDFTKSQRFSMLDGDFLFGGNDHYHGFGAGRTFPAMEGGKPVLRLGAVATLVEGFGKFKGKTGLYAIQGWITPPNGLGLNYLSRIIDTDSIFLTDQELPPMEPIPDPDPNATFMTFLGENDPTQPPSSVSTTVREQLRLIHIGNTVGGSDGIFSNVKIGQVVGARTADFVFNPFDLSRNGTIQSPYPFTTENTAFSFFDAKGESLGGFKSNVTEGRAVTFPVAGSPIPAFRIAGFGAIKDGTGQFSGMEGMVTVNSITSLKHHVTSEVFMIRLYDPEGKFRNPTN